MSRPSRGFGRRPQPPGRFIVAALLATLVLAALLGMSVLTTARYHRSVAEGVLRDYAGFAAGELEARVQAALAQRLFPVVSVLATRGGLNRDAPLPAPELLRTGVDSMVWTIVGDSLTPFRVVPGGKLETSGSLLPPSTRTWLADTLGPAVERRITPRSYLGLLWPRHDQRVVVFTAGGGSVGSSRILYGFVMRRAAIGELLAPALARAPLLPPTLTGGTRLDSVVAYRISAPDDLTLAGSGVPSGPFRANRMLDSTWGGLLLEVSLRPELAAQLVIGGLPRSRLPQVLLLLALTTLLVITALFQLRRERELSRAREDFVAGASHEFRTPLAQIRLFAETLRLGRVRSEAERERSFEIIEQETLRLNHLVENLLYVSRIGRGVQTVVPRVRDIAADLRDAVEGFGPIAAARHATIELSSPARLEAGADGDALRQMVLNLLDNAVKYGPPGQTVTVRLEAPDGRVRLTVDDQGPGVPLSERSRIFQRFIRLERDREANTSGAGIGLSLVQELARLHRGRAWVDAAPGGGARFVVEWPGDPGS